MKKEAEEALLIAEMGSMHGYASVMVKGHARERARAWRKLGHGSTERTGKPNVRGWMDLAAKFTEMGWSVNHGGERVVQ